MCKNRRQSRKAKAKRNGGCLKIKKEVKKRHVPKANARYRAKAQASAKKFPRRAKPPKKPRRGGVSPKKRAHRGVPVRRTLGELDRVADAWVTLVAADQEERALWDFELDFE